MRDTLGTVESGAWGGGILKSVDETLLPPNASPRGLNSALALSRTGVPYVQKRKGLSCLTETPLTGSEPILGQHDYVEVSTGIRRHLCTTATTIAVKDSAGTFSVLGTPLTSSNPPLFVTANSLAFIFNGTDAYKVRGTTIENVGIVRPVVGSLAGAAGAAGLHNGEYELRVAYQNSATGHISSASDTATLTVTVNNKKIDWTNVPVSPDPQVDTRLLLVRNVATQSQFYVAGTINNNTTTTASTNIKDENLLTVAPTRTNRNPPPSGTKCGVVYRGRLVVSNGEGIAWSLIDEPEAFDSFAVDLIDSSGDEIVGLAINQDTLLILKDDRTFALTGDLGGNYTLTLIDSDIGLVAPKTVVNAGAATYWWSRHGIVKYLGGAIDRIGLRLFGDPSETVNLNTITVASAVLQEERGTIYFALPDVGQTRATFILPYNYVLEVLESERWDPMDAASLGKAIDGSGVLQPTLGNYAGQVFQMWRTNNDGVRANTSTGGTFTASSSSITSATITDAVGRSIDTLGGGLLERKITILDSNGAVITPTLRPTIVSTSGTNVVTWNTPIAVTAGSPYTLVIGGPNFQFDTPWRRFGDEWIKKRFEYLFLLIKGADFGAAASVVMSFDYDGVNLNNKDRTFTSAAVGAAFDAARFDIDVWDTGQTIERRYRVARTGRAWRARIINAAADQPFALLLISAQAEGQTVKQ